MFNVDSACKCLELCIVRDGCVQVTYVEEASDPQYKRCYLKDEDIVDIRPSPVTTSARVDCRKKSDQESSDSKPRFAICTIGRRI